ncbi:hypothetical protein LTR15_011039 [Elasticomyces elasticus]|nr:hypothetical protein LTR15_011039 [Elasticomyces elasticus]
MLSLSLPPGPHRPLAELQFSAAVDLELRFQHNHIHTTTLSYRIMAKHETEDPTSAKKEKKEKKDKKRKHSEVEPADPVTPSETPAKKEKKEKKAKKSKTVDLTEEPAVVDEDGDVEVVDAAPVVDVKDEEDEDKKVKIKIEIPMAALVPFANPLCDEKAQKKVLKGVKKAAKSKALKRGVKECVKAIRKSPPTTTVPAAGSLPIGIVILAADISPMDVISHIPVLCEDHGIPYLYVPSRAELGAAGSTKRPTSVVMLSPKVGKGVDGEKAGEEWEETYKELNKLAVKLGQVVKV